MSIVETEQVMVVSTQLFNDCGYFQGFCGETERYLETLLDPAHTQYRPRNEMEQDPGFKQLIPYCIFQFVNDEQSVEVFQYTRGKGQGEKRLHSKRSVGIGGHISTLDAHDDSPYDLGMQRELEEEVVIDTPYHQKQIGLINDDQTDVGKVHLGVVHLFTVEQPKVSARESEIIESGFCSIEELMKDMNGFESWSRICLEAIYGD